MSVARRLPGAVAALAALLLWATIGAVAATAAPITVDVRVEGAEATLYEGTVETSVHRVDGADGTGSHVCSGPIGEPPGPTLTGALDDALRVAGLPWRGIWSGSSGDFFIDSVAGEQATPSGPWSILLNGEPTPVGGCSARVRPNDRVLLARDVVFSSKTLRLEGPGRTEPGEAFSLFVVDERDAEAPVAGATVTGGSGSAGGGAGGGPSAMSDSRGVASLTIEEAGTYRFKASHPDGIRSNAVEVCVGVSGCEADPDPQGPPLRILKLDEGQAFLRGASPRILRGRLNAGSGVRLALRARHGGRCRAWSGGRRALVDRRCGARPIWFRAPSSSGQWSYRLRALAPGRYRLLGRAVGTPSVKWRRGVNRIDFSVRGRRLSRTGLARSAARYLRRSAGRAEVRGSGLYSAWSTLALGQRRDPGADRAVRALVARRPGALPTGELARNLAALQVLRRGPARLRGEGRIRRRTGMIGELERRQSADGSFDGSVNLTAMAILALPRSAAAGRAAEWLEGAQGERGGFGHGPGSPPDVDTTGLASWALASEGRDASARRSGGFLRSLQNHDGGFPSMPGGASNAQSTGLAMAGLRAGRINPARLRTEDGITPFHYLAVVQRRDGRLDYAPGRPVSPAWVTAQALIGLTRRGRLIAGLSP